MRGALAKWIGVLAVCAFGAGYWGSSAAWASTSVSAAAGQGVQEFIGSGDGSPVGWNTASGLWGAQTGPYWWQSAVGISTLAHYGEQTGQLASSINNVLVRTYQANVSSASRPNFIDSYTDDTGWWGLAWLAAAQYELYSRHDQADATRFLATAEADASHIAKLPKACGGIEWTSASGPHTINEATFIALSAGLTRFRQAIGPFHNATLAASWLADARGQWGWLAQSGLIDLSTGEVTKDGISSSSDCTGYEGGPVSYTQGEVAEAEVQLGEALGQPSYYNGGALFLQYAIDPGSPFVSGGILQDRCEAISTNCSTNPQQLDITAFKGIFMQAMGDWVAVTRNTRFSAFLQSQAGAIVSSDIYGAPANPCASPSTCQFGMSWARVVSPMLVTYGTQESALGALIGALPPVAPEP